MAVLAKIIGVFGIIAGVGVGGLVVVGYFVALSDLPVNETGRSEESAAALMGLLVGGVVGLLVVAAGVGMWLLGAAAERRTAPPVRYDPTVRR